MPNINLNATRASQEQQRLFSKGTAELPLSDLLPSPENGRKRLRLIEDLAGSFDDDGIVQPLTAVPAALYISHYPQHRDYVEGSGKPYVLLAGHRRLAAAEKHGLDKVPVHLVKTMKEGGSLRLSSIKENEMRIGLDPIEQGIEYQKALDELDISQRDLAKRIGKGASQGLISLKVKLVGLIEPLQQQVIDQWCKQKGLPFDFGGERLLSIKEGALLAGLRPDLQQAYADGRLTMDDAERIIKSKAPLENQQIPAPLPPAAPAPAPTPQPADGQQPVPPTGAAAPAPAAAPDPAAASAGASNAGDQAPVPVQRQPDPEQDQQARPSGGAAPVKPPVAANTAAGESEVPANQSTVATASDRGVIAVTTVPDIYASLKASLSPDEFVQLQDLILGEEPV
ncbi:ParB N-terminal domain-containing protein [Streptomyces sp. NPDC012765]|uniref:ParB/RepB/Spo0J family partition protein n=1 Tax=Streptomyces sp. NPDC012765 TaxID=3155249 RepID=UPI0034028B93